MLIADMADVRVDEVLSLGLVPRFVDLLHSPNLRVQDIVLGLVIIITAAEEIQVQKLIDFNVLTPLQRLVIDCENCKFRKEACIAIANIAVGTDRQAGAVVDAGIIPTILKILVNEISNEAMVVEACWVLSNVITTGSKDLVLDLIDLGVIPALCSQLESHNTTVQLNVLDALEVMLRASEEEDRPCRQAVEDSRGLENLKKLQVCLQF
jgi:hypothetical protein